MAHCLPLLQDLAYRRYLGEDQPGHPPTPAGSPEKRASAHCRRGGFPVGEDYRGGRRRARLRWRQEGKGPQAPHPGGHRGLRAQSEGPHRKGHGLRGDKDATASSTGAIPSPPSSVAGRWLPRRGQGQGLGREGLGMERGSPRAPAKASPRRGSLKSWAREWAKEGVAVDWQKLLPPKGFQVLPRRWVVERTFSWIEQNRR